MRRHSDTLRGANTTTKEEDNGGENTRTSFLRSEGVVVPVKSEPLHFSLVLITFVNALYRMMQSIFTLCGGVFVACMRYAEAFFVAYIRARRRFCEYL